MRVRIQTVRQAGIAAIIVWSVLLSSCRLVDPHDPTDISLTVGAPGYLAGEEAILTIRNQSGRTITYNLCFAELERQDGGVWMRIDRSRTCPSPQNVLVHGEQATHAYRLDSTLEAGTYRFVYTFTPAGADELTLISNRFDVDRPSAAHRTSSFRADAP